MKHILFLAVWLLVLTRETITQKQTPSSQHGCKFWSTVAHNLTHIHERTNDILHMVCKTDNNTNGEGCTEMKCGGKFQQLIPIFSRPEMNFNFCFGFRLNHCDDPVSMSYFFKVPDKNYTKQGTVNHNDTYEIPGGKFEGIDTTVIVLIEMVRTDDHHIEFGIQGEVRATGLFGGPIFDPKVQVFPPTLIDITQCSDGDKKKTRPAFEPLEICGLPPNYTTMPPPKLTTRKYVRPATYNRSCELGVVQCSVNEMCQGIGSSSSRNGICVCQPMSKLNPDTGKCELSFPTLLTTAGLQINGSTAVPSVTQASTSKNNSLSVVAIAVIGVVGGLLVIVVIVSVIIYIGRRKRSAIYRDRHQLLTTDDDDDDVNLVI